MSACDCKGDHGISSTGYCPNCGHAKPYTAEQQNVLASLFSSERFGSEPGRERDTEGLIHEATATIATLRARVAVLEIDKERMDWLEKEATVDASGFFYERKPRDMRSLRDSIDKARGNSHGA